jgi:hypothetical protein
MPAVVTDAIAVAAGGNHSLAIIGHSGTPTDVSLQAGSDWHHGLSRDIFVRSTTSLCNATRPDAAGMRRRHRRPDQ